MKPALLPPVVDGEALRSYVARTFALNQIGRLELAHALFGRAWLTADWALPTQLAWFARRVGVYLGQASERYWLQRHTVAPFYCTTLASERASRFEERMAFGRPGPRRPLIALGTGEWFTPWARLCPACDADLRAKHGFSVVMREWVLPFVTHCALHAVSLSEHPHWSPLEPGPSLASRPPPALAAHAQWLARQSLAWLAEPSGRVQLLHSLLQERGFLTMHGRIRRQALCAHLQTYLSERQLHPELAQCLGAEETVMRLLAPLASRGALHPTVAIYLTAALEESIATKVEPACSPRKRAVHNEVAAQVPAQGSTATEVARRAGVSVTTAVVHLMALGHSVRLRPKHLTPARRLRVQQMLAAGADIADVVEAEEVSVSSVYRLMAASAQIRAARRQAIESSRLHVHRLRWMQLLEANPEASRKELRQFDSPSYMYLYRHARDWLRSTLAQIPRRPSGGISRTRRTPEGADAALLHRLTACADAMPCNRRSSTWLVGAAGRGHVSRIDPATTPQSARLAAALAEATPEFVQRRLMEGARNLRADGGGLEGWRISRASGLRSTSIVRARADLQEIACQVRAEILATESSR